MVELIKEVKAENPYAKTVLIFGSNPHLRNHVVRDLGSIGNLNVYGTLNENEGFEMFHSLPKVDLILIGQAYSVEQRKRIKLIVRDKSPNTQITEPGVDFSVENDGVKRQVKTLLNLK